MSGVAKERCSSFVVALELRLVEGWFPQSLGQLCSVAPTLSPVGFLVHSHGVNVTDEPRWRGHALEISICAWCCRLAILYIYLWARLTVQNTDWSLLHRNINPPAALTLMLKSAPQNVKA